MNDFKGIEATSEFGRWVGDEYVTDFTDAYTQDDHDKVRDLLVGHAVVKVADDHLQLDDGTLLKFVGHEGGCACSAGDYDLTALNGVENVITGVEFDDSPGGDDAVCPTCGKDYCYEDGHESRFDGAYRIFVFAGDQRINLATFEGSDGNGYYGTGYYVLVRRPVKEAAR